MDTAKKKQLRDAYKRKPAVGAIYCITCSGNQRRYIKGTLDVGGIRNRYNFSIATKGCPDPSLRDEWLAYGYESFSLEILEELTMKEDQTDDEFEEDMELLLELWKQKLAPAEEREGSADEDR